MPVPRGDVDLGPYITQGAQEAARTAKVVDAGVGGEVTVDKGVDRVPGPFKGEREQQLEHLARVVDPDMAGDPAARAPVTGIDGAQQAKQGDPRLATRLPAPSAESR